MNNSSPTVPEKAEQNQCEIPFEFVRRQCSDAATRHGFPDSSQSFSALAVDQLFLESAMNESTQTTRGFNVIFIHSSLDDAKLTCAQFRVYAHLSRRASDGVAWPGVDSVASICRMHRETVIESVTVLEKRGMISIQRKEGMRNLYTLLPPTSWINQSEMVNGSNDQSEMVNATSRKSGTPPVGNGERKDIHLRKSNKGNPFVKPTLSELQEEMKKREMPDMAQKFIDYYDSKGWMIGNSRMKSWKAAVGTWLANWKEKNSVPESKQLSKQEMLKEAMR